MTDEMNGVEFVRTADGTWRYRDSGLRVPGAGDRKVASKIKPETIVGADKTAKAVVLDAALVEAHLEALAWCKTVGEVVQRDGEVTRYIVSQQDWEKHGEKLLGIDAPAEFSANPYEAAMARVEVEYRLWEREGAKIAGRRLELIRAGVANGVSRIRAAEIHDISAARITQLLNPSTKKKSTKKVSSKTGKKPATPSSLNPSEQATLALIIRRGDATVAEITKAGATTSGVSKRTEVNLLITERLKAAGFVIDDNGRLRATADGTDQLLRQGGVETEAVSLPIEDQDDSPGAVTHPSGEVAAAVGIASAKAVEASEEASWPAASIAGSPASSNGDPPDGLSSER
jgi:hypothetical protein